MDKTTGTFITDEVEHIRQSIADILKTPIGSRLQRRNYGSSLFELIDENINPITAMRIASSSIVAIQRWEPRINVTNLKVSYDEKMERTLIATINAEMKKNKHSFSTGIII